MSGDFSLHDAIAGSDWPCAPTRALSQPTLPFKLSRGPDMHSAHSFVRCAALADGLPAATPEARPGLVFSSLRCLVLTWLLLRTGAFHLACVMGQCRKIEALELGGNNLGKEGGWLVAGALAGCPQLRTMDLEGNNIGDQVRDLSCDHRLVDLDPCFLNTPACASACLHMPLPVNMMRVAAARMCAGDCSGPDLARSVLSSGSVTAGWSARVLLVSDKAQLEHE